MLRWQSSVRANYDPRRASAGAPVNPDQFTDSLVPPQLPQVGWWQKATTYGALLYCIFLGVYAVFVILSSWLPVLTLIAQAPLFALCNFFFLVFTGGLERHLKKQLNKEQEQGYLRFSSHLDWLVYQPFGIVAYGGGAALVVVAWDLQQEMAIPHLRLLQLVILIQITWAAALVGVYIWKVHQHNILHHQPDAMHSLYSPLQPPRSLAGIKYIDRGGLGEQQSIYIQSQQDNLQHLMKEYLRLWENLQKYKQSQDGSTTPQVDLVHLLASREQEIRAIAAERDFLQDEVRVARGVIWEKDSDMQSIRSVNDEHVEENERLRAELDEWSSRTAKLELALELEQRSSLELHKKLPR
ncbi:unnamed protein product [Sphagnum balticum]